MESRSPGIRCGLCAFLLAATWLHGAAYAAVAEAAAADAAATVFYDGQVFTAERDRPYAEALAIRGDRILAVGVFADVERAAGPRARRVDLKGRFLMPGMIDAHAHPVTGGLTLIQANFPEAGGNVAGLARYARQELRKGESRQGEVLVINGLDLGYWTHTIELEAALSQGEFAATPVVLWGSDGHTAWANRPARARAGITAEFIRSLDPNARRFYGVDAALNPNGFVVDAGLERLQNSVPPPSPATLLKAGRAALRYLNGLGITAWLDAAVSGHVAGTAPAKADDPGYLPVYRTLSQRGELTAHVVAYPVVQPDAGFQQIDVIEALRRRFADIPDFKIPGLKVFADGVVEIPAQTAALSHPYVNNGRAVKTLFTPEKMNALVVEAYRRGLTVHVHAIGDLAVKGALDAFEAARRANPGTRLPMVLTHAQFVDPEDIPRFGQLHVIAALQLLWADGEESTIDQVQPYIDPRIYRWMYPARSILDTDGEIAGASDWPVSSADPFEAMAVAETRKGPKGVLDAAQRVPREVMLYAYTRNAAEVLDELDEIGTLAPGKRADLVLIDRDVLTVPVTQLAKAKVVFTMFGGRLVYGREP